jgi:hypothetical protein
MTIFNKETIVGNESVAYKLDFDLFYFIGEKPLFNEWRECVDFSKYSEVSVYFSMEKEDCVAGLLLCNYGEIWEFSEGSFASNYIEMSKAFGGACYDAFRDFPEVMCKTGQLFFTGDFDNIKELHKLCDGFDSDSLPVLREMGMGLLIIRNNDGN